MKRLRTLKLFQIFSTEIKKSKTYSGWCPFKGLSNGTTLMQIQSGRTVPLKKNKNWRAGCALSTASSIDVQGVSPATAISMNLQGVSLLCVPFYRQQYLPVIPVLEWTKMPMLEHFRYHNKRTQSGTGMLRYRTEIQDAGMLMPAAASISMPMPSCTYQYKYMGCAARVRLFYHYC